jgi:acetolactate synthase-1/2/3 large subunit
MPGKKGLKGARFIAETLKGYGVTHVFYMEAMLRMTAVEMEALGIERIIAHSEKSAAYMADGYARISRKPGICMAQSVGAANLAAGLQDPWLGKSPVIALTGQKTPLYRYRNAYQEIPHQDFFSAVTKFNAEVNLPEQLPFILRQAFREATSGVPRPVHIDLPDYKGRVVESSHIDSDPVVEKIYGSYPVFRPNAPSDAIAKAGEAIARSKRPVIVAGGGARISGAGDRILHLARKAQMPVVTTLSGKGTISENDPLWGGIVGFYSMKSANQIVHHSDLVIYIGSNTGDQSTFDWQVPQPGKKVIQMDIDPAELGRNYPNTIGLPGDATAVCEQLVDAVSETRRPEWLEKAAGYLGMWDKEYENLLTSEEVPIRPERICRELEKKLPENAVLVSDTGYSAIWTATMMRLKPTQAYLRAAGSLGWAFPAAIGAKCGAPDRPVVCFCGDGGFYYHISELETARRCRINTVTVVNNNNALSQGVDDVENVYAGKSGTPNSLYRFEPVNISRVAEGFGCMGIRVEHPEEIAPALDKALTADRPVVVEVMTDISARTPVPWKPC